MKLRQLVIAALAVSNAATVAVANTTPSSSASTTQSSNQGYFSTQGQDPSQSGASLSSSSAQGDTSQVTQIQQALNDKGFNAGPADGKMGPKTKSALKQFQESKGLQKSGQLDQQTLAALDLGSSSSSQGSGSSGFSPQPGSTSSQSQSNPAQGDTANAQGSTNQPSSSMGGNNGSTSSSNGGSAPSQQPGSNPK